METKLAPHPGQLVKAELTRLNLTTPQGAEMLGVSRPSMYRLVAGTHSLSPEMALRLEAVLGGTAEEWLHKQADYDAGQVRHHKSAVIAGLARYRPAPPPPQQAGRL